MFFLYIFPRYVVIPSSVSYRYKPLDSIVSKGENSLRLSRYIVLLGLTHALFFVVVLRGCGSVQPLKGHAWCLMRILVMMQRFPRVRTRWAAVCRRLRPTPPLCVATCVFVPSRLWYPFYLFCGRGHLATFVPVSRFLSGVGVFSGDACTQLSLARFKWTRRTIAVFR